MATEKRDKVHKSVDFIYFCPVESFVTGPLDYAFSLDVERDANRLKKYFFQKRKRLLILKGFSFFERVPLTVLFGSRDFLPRFRCVHSLVTETNDDLFLISYFLFLTCTRES